MQVESLDDGQVIYSRNPDELLNPASNTKLVTAAAGLLRLGPEYRFNTDYLSDKPLINGRLGTLYVKGRADPSVTTERLDTLVGDLWHRGVRNVGDIVLDDSFFDREEFGAGWEQESSDKAWAAGVGALSLNHNAVAIYITSGDRTGARARVEVEPDAHDYFVVDNRVVTVRANGRRKLRPRTIPEGERTRILVEGRIPLPRETVRKTRTRTWRRRKGWGYSESRSRRGPGESPLCARPSCPRAPRCPRPPRRGRRRCGRAAPAWGRCAPFRPRPRHSAHGSCTRTGTRR